MAGMDSYIRTQRRRTLELTTRIGRPPLTVLVDSGSTSNYIDAPVCVEKCDISLRGQCILSIWSCLIDYFVNFALPYVLCFQESHATYRVPILSFPAEIWASEVPWFLGRVFLAHYFSWRLDGWL